MRSSLLALLTLSVGTALASPAPAQRRFLARPGAARIAPLRQAMQELGLTPLQRRQLQQMRRDRREELARLSMAIRDSRRALADMYRAYPLDEARASLLVQQIAQMEAQRMRLQLQNQIDLRRILTRDQFIRFNQMVEPGPPARTPVP